MDKEVVVDRIEKVINFYNLAVQLKTKLRSGWLKWHVSSDRIESIAEHVYGTCILAISIDSEFDININLDKVIRMLVLHELEEIVIGDITPYDNISKEEKLELGKDAVDKLLDGMIKKDEYVLLLDEFNSCNSDESIFAFCCDKLEADLQAKNYDDSNQVNIFDDRNKMLLDTEFNKKSLENGSDKLSDLFIDYDINNYTDLFKSIANYIKDSNRGNI